jgi:hypothetical protein
MPSLKEYISEAISSKRNSNAIEPYELKAGDKVRVKSRKDIESICKKANGNQLAYYFDLKGAGMTYIWVTDGMLDMCGENHIIDMASVDGITVMFKGDKYHWSWHIDLLERV